MKANFYFYFSDQVAAQRAIPALEREGLTVEIRSGADEASWLALGTAGLERDDQLDALEERFGELAEELGADYDGYDRG